MSRKIIIFLCFITVFSRLSAVQLQWDFGTDDRIEVVKTADITYFVNKEVQSKYFERNIADLTCTDKNNTGCKVNGSFSIFSKQHDKSTFKLESQSESTFTIQKNGHFDVPSEHVMPNLRHIPQFPDKDLKKGDTWTNTAKIIIDNFSKPFSIKMPVQYAVSSIKKDDDSHTAEIAYLYTIDNYLEKGSVPADFPRRILAKDEGIISWDVKNNKPLKFKNLYHVVFLFPTQTENFASHEWIMKINTDHTVYPHVPEPKQEEDKEELAKDFSEEDGVSVEEDKRGLVIRLGEILFDFDSAKVKDSTKKTLNKIMSVVQKKYPDREIIVGGHTDNTGNPHYNQELSEKRAQNVAKRILSDLDHDKVSYIGHGESEPIAPNDTKEGRKQNRRVDILIKLK